jgi:hypothetical protein
MVEGRKTHSRMIKDMEKSFEKTVVKIIYIV